MATPHFPVNVEDLAHKWGWFLVLGILLILLGIASLVYTPAATLASVLVLGWLMFFSGIVEAVHAFHARGWVGVLLHVAGGALGIFIGLLVATHPVAGSARMDPAICLISYSDRAVSYCCSHIASIPELAVGGVRWNRDSHSWPPDLGGHALVGVVVSRLRSWNCLPTSRLVQCNVCVGSSRNRPYSRFGPPSRTAVVRIRTGEK